MKKLSNLTFILLTILIFTSCKSNSKFGDKVDKIFWSKRYKAVLIERDELCSNNKQLQRDTTELGVKLRNTEKELTLSSENYDELASKTGVQLAKLTSDLKLKSIELENKEALLLERERRLREMESIISKQDSLTTALNNIVKNALLGFNSDELSVEMRNGKVYVSMNDKLLFKSGSAGVEEKGKQAIKKLAEVLNKNTEIDIAIEGHTDNIPIKTAQYKDNWDLSVARATSIVRMLSEENGLQPKRLTASGKGEYFPIAANDTNEGRSKNRRTEIILSPKLDELFKLLQKTK